jgi:membrane-associated protease RseP (regulator of RpoE activity)
VIVARREGPVKEVAVAVRSVIDPGGRFTIPDLEPGEYRVRAAAHAHAPTRPADVVVPEPPADAAPIDLFLSRGAKLTGKVIEAGGGPIPLARVSIENAFGDASVSTPIAATAISDEHGDFELAGVPPGARSIMVAAYAHHIRLLSGMSFVDGATVGPITVDLTPTKDGEEPRIELAGIGAVLAVEGDGLRIDKVIPGGGAEAAALVPGDVLIAVDGEPVASLGFDGAVQRIRGPVGSTVRLTVRRTGGAVVEVVAPRRRIRA